MPRARLHLTGVTRQLVHQAQQCLRSVQQDCMHREVGRFSYRPSNSYFLQETSPSQSSETGSRGSTSRKQSLVDIPKAGSQGEVQDFLPLTIDTKGAYQDDESDEDLPPAKRSCFREEEEEEDEEGDQTLQVFDPANYFQSEKKYDPPENIASYVSQNFQRCLNKATRRKLAREHPQPSIPAITPPSADDVLVDFLGNKFLRKTDDTLRSYTCSSPSRNSPPHQPVGRDVTQWVIGPGRSHLECRGCSPSHTEGTGSLRKCSKLHLQNQTRSNPDAL